ncbi:MAG: PorT family protein, partial [Flavisolibacter sp.]|nr:PorT family protein [Flavisolibacter sp.]
MRKALIILTALFLATTSYAQVRFGLKAGGNLANMDGFDKTKMKLGLSAGPALQVKLANVLFLQTELLYSIKGTRSDSMQNANAKLDLNYINLPILIGYRLAPNFSIKLGPEIGRLLSAKSEIDGNTTDITDFYQSFDFGADLGLAYSFKKIALDLRYNYGFKDLLERANGNGQEETKM